MRCFCLPVLLARFLLGLLLHSVHVSMFQCSVLMMTR
jgi:hypothetical protein